MLDQYMDRAVLSELPATYNKLLHQYESEAKEPDMGETLLVSLVPSITKGLPSRTNVKRQVPGEWSS